MKSKQISAERPLLLSTASFAEFSAWKEPWYDFTVCQQLAAQSHKTRVSAVRLSFDEEIIRYLREGIIKVSPNADVPEFIKAGEMFFHCQRNSLLDRIDFYNRQQDKGELFGSFFAALRELYNVSDFSDLNLCQRCSTVRNEQCGRKLQKVKEDMMRDRIMTGVGHDEVRHKLLSQTDLMLRGAIRICRAKEAATKTEDGMALPSPKMSNYGRQKQNRGVTESAAEEEKKATASRGRYKNCGWYIHTYTTCPAAYKRCHKSQKVDIFMQSVTNSH